MKTKVLKVLSIDKQFCRRGVIALKSMSEEVLMFRFFPRTENVKTESLFGSQHKFTDFYVYGFSW